MTPRQKVALFILVAVAWLLLACSEGGASPPCTGAPAAGHTCIDRQGQEWTGTRQGVPVVSGR